MHPVWPTHLLSPVSQNPFLHSGTNHVYRHPVAILAEAGV